MARSIIDAPYDVTFPPVCARCTAPATKTLRIQRQKPSASQTTAWFFFGILGWLAAGGASKDAALRYEIPICDNCHSQQRIFQALTWIGVVLFFVVLCGGIALAPAISTDSSTSGAIMAVAMLLAFFILIAAIAVGVFTTSRQPVVIQRIDEKLQSIRLGFLNPSYFERFREQNLERILTLGLRSGKGAQLPFDQAVATLSQRIDPDNPRSPDSLRGYFERGQLYLQQRSYDQAVADLNRVVEVTGFENPYFLDAQYFRGLAHMGTGNAMQAQIDLENYLKAASDKARIKHARQCLKQMGRG